MKELVLLDLGKKDAEIRHKLREFAKLYEVVKNERNSYVNAIQTSSQALAEMKERIKILHNEVEILQVRHVVLCCPCDGVSPTRCGRCVARGSPLMCALS